MKQRFEHAIVIGGSLGGLLVARALSDFSQRVTILERDVVEDGPLPRKGQPQVRHLHGLLAKGLDVLSAFFPDLKQGLLEGGAIFGDMGQAIRWYCYGGYRKQYQSGLTGALMSRPFLEWEVRRRVLALPNVTLLSACAVEGLLASADRRRVTGVRVVHREDTIRRDTLPADLVVDVSGRGSASAKWLAALGYAPPQESEVTVNVRYATRIFRRRPGDLPGAELLMVTGTAPVHKHGGMAFPLEGDRWIVTLAGVHGERPPTDEEGFIAFARELPAPDLYRLISRVEPLSEIVPYRFSASLRRHYEKLRRFPDGYLVMGDAVCSFNPIYGQGMTSVAMQAQTLYRLLAQRERKPHGLWRQLFKETAKVVDIPWQSAVGEDFRFAETQGPKAPGTDLINAYVTKVHAATHHDTVVYGQFLKVMNLMAPPSSLFRPAIMRRVLRQRLSAAPARQAELVIGD